MPKPLIIDEHYPTTDGITPDAHSLSVILPAYASPRSELNAILQYFYHFFNFDKQGLKDDASKIERIAIAEMHHLEILGKMIINLGARPIYCLNPPTAFNFYSTKCVTYSCDLKSMIEDDINAEELAIRQYRHMLKHLKNCQICEIISRIIKDEELHLATFKEILSGL